MNVTKFGPPEVRGPDVDFDIYFTLNRPEADAAGSDAGKAMIVSGLIALGGALWRSYGRFGQQLLGRH